MTFQEHSRPTDPGAADPGLADAVVAEAVGAGDRRLAPEREVTRARAEVAAARGPAEAVAATLAFLDGHPDALWRSCGPGHLTGSAFVVDGTATRTLLLRHRKLRRWLQPGGHADGDANLAGVALREATEETGMVGLAVVPRAVDVDIHRVAPPGEVPHHHFDVRYLVLAPEGAVARHNHEATGQRWVHQGELADLDLDVGLHRLANRAFALAQGRSR